MDDIMIMCEIKHQQELYSEPPHHQGWDPAFDEPSPKARQYLAHNLKDETDVRAVGPGMLKVVQQMADMVVT